MIARAADSRDIACRLGWHRKRVRYPRAIWPDGSVVDATFCTLCERLLEARPTGLALHLDRTPALGSDGIDDETS